MAEFDEKLNAILSDPGAMAQIMQLAQNLGGPGESAAPPPESAPTPPTGGSAPSLDPQLFARFLPLLQELGGQQNSNARTLLLALRPYLKPERQEKVERAVQLAHLFHAGKSLLAGWGNTGHV